MTLYYRCPNSNCRRYFISPAILESKESDQRQKDNVDEITACPHCFAILPTSVKVKGE